MVKVRIQHEEWKGDNVEKDIYYEICQNEECSCGEIHYPYYMKTAFCPQCKTPTIGVKLDDSVLERVEYHLED